MIGICVGLLHKRQYDYLCTGCFIWKKQPVHNQQLSRRCLLWRGNEVGSWSGLGEERFRDSQFDIVGWGGGIFVGGLQYPSKLRQYDFLCTVSALKGKWTVIVLLLCLFGQVRIEVLGEARGCETPEAVLWLKIRQMAAVIMALEWTVFCHFGLFPESGGFFKAKQTILWHPIGRNSAKVWAFLMALLCVSSRVVAPPVDKSGSICIFEPLLLLV